MAKRSLLSRCPSYIQCSWMYSWTVVAYAKGHAVVWCVLSPVIDSIYR